MAKTTRKKKSLPKGISKMKMPKLPKRNKSMGKLTEKDIGKINKFLKKNPIW